MIHEIWNKRFSKFRDINVHYFLDPEKAMKLIGKLGNEFLLLCDYEFDFQEINGIDVIERTNALSCSILVSGRFEDRKLIERCSKLGLKFLSKPLIPKVKLREFIQYEVIRPGQRY